MITVYMYSQNKCVWVSIINFLDFVSVLPPPGTFHEQYHAQVRHWLTQKDTKCVGCNMRGHYPL